MDKSFSVLIPAYKSRYLKEAIESVLAQTYQYWELIIVDDNSPNDLWKIVQEFKDNRISYYRNERSFGACDVVYNWNKCLSYAKGDYVICMGDDDCLLPCCLDEYVKLINKYPALNVYHAKTQLIDEDSNMFFFQESRPEYETAYSMLYNLWFYKRIQFIGDFLFKKDWLINNDGFCYFPYAFSSDWVTAFSAACNKGIANGQEFMFQYRVSRYSISTSESNMDKVFSCKEVWDWYKVRMEDVPDGEVDKQYWLVLHNRVDSYYTEWILRMIAIDFQKSHCIEFVPRVLFWFRNFDKLNIKKKVKIFL